MICFETLKVVDGKLQNLYYHQKRINRTRNFLGYTDTLELREDSFEIPKKGDYRLRIDYDKEIKSFTCKALTCREFKEFKIVKSAIEYEYKYTNRSELDILKADDKEIIIVKDGLLTDTTIANIALNIDNEWITPKKPLLQGTTRERLIEKSFLKCEDLSIEDLKKAQNFAIMNALIGFHIIKKAKIEFELGLERII